MSFRISNRILTRWITYFFIVIYLIPTDTNAFFNSLGSIIKPLRYIGLIWGGLLFIRIKGWNARNLWPIWSFLVIGLIASLVNGTDIKAYINFAYPILGVCSLLHYILYFSSRNTVFNICLVFCAFLIVQGISCLMGGFRIVIDGNNIPYVEYFMGQRTSISRILAFAVTLGVYIINFDSKKSHRIVAVLAILAAIYFVIFEKVSTAIMSLIIFFGVLMGARLIKNKYFWRTLSLIAFIACMVFVFNNDFFAKSFEWLLVDFLNKDMTLDGRTLLWTQALQKMNGWHWLIGNGYGHSYKFFIGGWSTGLTHSQYMGILFNFGTIGLLNYFFLIFIPLYKAKKRHFREYDKIITALIVTLIFTGISASNYTSIYIYVFFALEEYLPIYAKLQVASNDK